jgi:hypothetical protein
MRAVGGAALLFWCLMAGHASADTVYLKNGEALWAREVIEEGDSVVLVRGGEKMVVPRGQVDRIERAHISIPRYYEPPAQDTAKPQGPPAGGAAPVGQAGPPAAPPPLPSGLASGGDAAAPAAPAAPASPMTTQ